MLKTHLDKEDVLQLVIENERYLRAGAEANLAAATAEIAGLKMHIARMNVAQRYEMADGDHMDFITGAITRKPKPEAQAGN